MGQRYKHILIIADIEGSSGCWSYQGSSFRTEAWARACEAMTRDVDAVVKALFAAGVESVLVKDFHRTGFNLLPEQIDARCRIVHGYRRGPVPGIGNPDGAQAVMFLGMHAASGTGGFLAHTLTSRIEQLEVNGRPLAEVALFSASVAAFGLQPVFFSGCPVACRQATETIDGIVVYPIDKSQGPQRFDAHGWRDGLAAAAALALENDRSAPYRPQGPFQARVKMRAGAAVARKIARRWNFERRGGDIHLHAADMSQLYMQLIRLCYLTPLVEKILPLGLYAHNLRGRMGLAWVRRRLKLKQL